MGSSVNGIGALSVAGLLVLGVWAVSPAAGSEPVMCPPVTIEELFADDEPETEQEAEPTTTTTSTTPPPTTAPPAPSTTSAATPTTSPPPTSTVASPDTTTQPPGALPTTTSPPEPSTTAPPESVPGSPTTTAPEPSTTAPATTAAPETTTTTEPAEPPCDTPFVYPMVFPLAGAGYLGSPFGASRDGGSRYHLGNDIAAPILQPVMAVADGIVSRVTGDTGISGYRVHVRHDDGWSSLYIHLNNDTAGTDDGNGIGIRPDLNEGDRVQAGQLIGWNGDSGNAETTEPHLHFELQDPSGSSVDPRASLQAAERVTDSQFSGPFSDLAFDLDDVDPMILLLSRGMPAWCEDAFRACPDHRVEAEDVSVWLTALIGLPPVGCEADCGGVTEADIARAMAWELLRGGYQEMSWMEDDVPDSAWSTPPRRPPDRPGELDVVEAHLILGGSNRCLTRPDEERELTRREAARVIALYSGWTDVPSCPTNSANR